MKSIVRVLFAGIAVVMLAGCGEKKPVLHVYNWSDYIKPELVQRFEQESGCRVMMDYYDSNEAMYAKLKAGASGYDLLFPSSYMVNIMDEQGMLQPIDKAKIPNIANIDRKYLKFTMDPEMNHSVPYMISNSGIGYLGERVPDFEPTWAMFDREEYRGRMTLLNDMRETVGAALKLLGYSLNTTDEAQLAEARDVVIRWKKNIAKFESDQYKNGLVSAEFVLCHGYNGDVYQTMEENEDIGYDIPREGTSIASDDMAIPANATQVDLAHAFINFIHDPEVAAENTEYVYFLCPNTASYELLSDEIKEDPAIFMPDELIEKSEVILDLGEENAKYIKVWDEIKAAR
ncbi:MAG: spermidine/putrescine ABC transporter substrate-binding protein [Verrucomicrobia bacterium]|nr:spermidine/putrescine ABC transporter substrate-binding protein [Verrucomicrobiota bacterium]